MYKIFDTVDEVSFYTALRLLEKIQTKPDAILGLATGSTMESVYARLVSLLMEYPVDVAQLTTFNLDEYVGLNKGHAQSYSYYMHRHFFSKLSIPKERINLPDSMAVDIAQACRTYSERIRAMGGLDMQLLGRL